MSEPKCTCVEKMQFIPEQYLTYDDGWGAYALDAKDCPHCSERLRREAAGLKPPANPPHGPDPWRD